MGVVMGLFAPRPTYDDPARLLAAAHEIGHVLAARHAGDPATSATLYPDGGGTTEFAGKLDRHTPREVWRGWLVGCWAGPEAEIAWCKEYGGEPAADRWTGDQRNFRRHRDRAGGLFGLPESTARAEAGQIIRASWREFERLTRQLARDGRITW